MRSYFSLLMAELLVVSSMVCPFTAQAQSTTTAGTAAPITHIVLISNENISFDHHFGTYPNAANPTGCKRSTVLGVTATNKANYFPHHEPFQYCKSTANPTHAPPTSVVGA